jgi:hypothetical protein
MDTDKDNLLNESTRVLCESALSILVWRKGKSIVSEQRIHESIRIVVYALLQYK